MQRGTSTNGRGGNATQPHTPRIPIPDTTNLFIDSGWYGTLVVETEGTNEALADLQERCGPRAFPPRPKPANQAQAKAREENRKVWRILRERRYAAVLWISPERSLTILVQSTRRDLDQGCFRQRTSLIINHKQYSDIPLCYLLTSAMPALLLASSHATSAHSIWSLAASFIPCITMSLLTAFRCTHIDYYCWNPCLKTRDVGLIDLLLY